MSEKYNIYQKLFNVYLKAHPDGIKKKLQTEVNEFWNLIKHDKDCIEKANTKIKELQSKIETRKSKLLSFWNKSTAKQASSTTSSGVSSAESNTDKNNDDCVLIDVEQGNENPAGNLAESVQPDFMKMHCQSKIILTHHQKTRQMP